jgi:hypothetical protein
LSALPPRSDEVRLLHLLLVPGLQFGLIAGLVGDLPLLLPPALAEIAVRRGTGQPFGQHQLGGHHHLLRVVFCTSSETVTRFSSAASYGGCANLNARGSLFRRRIMGCAAVRKSLPSVTASGSSCILPVGRSPLPSSAAMIRDGAR